MKKTLCLTLLAWISSVVIVFAQAESTPAPPLPTPDAAVVRSAPDEEIDFEAQARAAAARQFRTMIITGGVLSVLVGGGVFLLGMRRKGAPNPPPA